MRSTHVRKSALSWPEASEPVLGTEPEAKAGAGAARMPSVCFVAPMVWPVFAGIPELKFVGGAEVQQSILARALSEAGFPVSMVCNDFGQADAVRVHGVTVYKTYRLDQGIPVVRFLYPRLSTTWAALRRADADIYYTRSSPKVAVEHAQADLDYASRWPRGIRSLTNETPINCIAGGCSGGIGKGTSIREAQTLWHRKLTTTGISVWGTSLMQ